MANEKVNTDVYYKVFWYHVLPLLKSTFPRDNYLFTQDVEISAAFMQGENGCLLAGRLLTFFLTQREPPLFRAFCRPRRTRLLTRMSIP
uniref:Uncharacterized protein n=1 Tax=Lepeophtheirus salmonis TaxID=72036 RepID=A0A0K2UC19_LEPSM